MTATAYETYAHCCRGGAAPRRMVASWQGPSGPVAQSRGTTHEY